MKKKLRVLALVLAVALISSVTTGATLAWFTAKAESKLNVITTGNIDISLTEDVAVIGEGGEIKSADENGAEYISVMPGDYLKKEVKVANTGSNPAYIAVTVDVNNYDKINAVIEHFGNGQDNDDAEAVLDSVFDGWGLTVKNRYLPDGTKDMSYKMGELVDNHILHVDAAKMINTQETNHFSLENWFKSDAEKAAAGYTVVGTKGFYHGGMENYSLRYTYYIYLESDEEVVLFKGLNIPSYFNNDQIEMFNGLEIEVNASAIQADNMGIHPDYSTKEMTAFAILNGSIEPEDVEVNNTPPTYAQVTNNAELKDAIEAGEVYLQLAANEENYKMPAAAKGKTLNIKGAGTDVTTIEVVPAGQGEAGGQLDYSLDGSNVTFENLTIKTNSQLYAGYARLSGTYNNCVIQNTYNLGVGNSVFNGCTFNITNEYLRVGGAYSAEFNGCTFNTDGRAILVFQDGTNNAQTVTVKDCTFNATAAAHTWNGIHVAAVSIDGTNGSYVVNLEGTNTVDSDFNGLWQIKAGAANVTVNE